jgi:tRNA(fMet)-specific endonuclease VapC
MKRYVLDTTALLILFADRPGAKRVDSLIHEAARTHNFLMMSAVNWGEAYYSVGNRLGEDQARQLVEQTSLLPLAILPADRDRASNAAGLQARYRLGYAHSFAAALAMEQNAVLVSCDPDFEKLGKRLTLLRLPRHTP